MVSEKLKPIATERVLRSPRQAAAEWLPAWTELPVRVALADEWMWLRYPLHDQQARSLERSAPGTRYRLVEQGWLIRDGCQVAEASLPALHWQPIKVYLDISLPTAAMGGSLRAAKRPSLELTRGGIEQPPAAALVSLEALQRWAHTAPAIRLDPLVYCVAGPTALVVGSPLPTTTGQLLCRYERLLIPAGMTWKPRLDAASVCELFGVGEHETLLWTTTENWSIISIQTFGPLSRGSLRALANPTASS